MEPAKGYNREKAVILLLYILYTPTHAHTSEAPERDGRHINPM